MAKGKFRKELRKREQEKIAEENLLMTTFAKDLYKGEIKRGDIFFFDKGITLGVEQHGGRPGIIVSNDKCNKTSDFVLVVYLTTEPKTFMPNHIKILSSEKESTALCEQIHTLSKAKVQSYKAHVTDEEMKAINKALLITLGFDLSILNPSDYDDLVKKLSAIEEEYDNLKVENTTLQIRIKNLIMTNEKLEQQLEQKEKQRTSNAFDSELLKVKTERDMYENLYNGLLEKFLKDV